MLAYESPTKNFRFEYDAAWYIRGEERNLFSFRHLKDHELEAHCTGERLATRSAGRHTPLDEFERDVRQSLGEKLETVSAATEWETKQGYNCLGVIADGKVNDVPIQWRNYLVSADDCPRLSLAVTLEREAEANNSPTPNGKSSTRWNSSPRRHPKPETASTGDAVAR